LLPDYIQLLNDFACEAIVMIALNDDSARTARSHSPARRPHLYFSGWNIKPYNIGHGKCRGSWWTFGHHNPESNLAVFPPHIVHIGTHCGTQGFQLLNDLAGGPGISSAAHYLRLGTGCG
jgi:hypothetical protein